MRRHSWLETEPLDRCAHSRARLLAAVLAAGGLFASPSLWCSPSQPFSENDEARATLRELVFSPLAEVSRAAERVIRQSDGERVLFRVQKQNGAVYLTFTRADLVPPRLDAAGTFIIKRSAADGSFLQAKVFLQDDPGCFIRLTPRGERTSLALVLFDELYQREVVVPASFESLLTSPFSRIERLTNGAVDWQLVLPAAPSRADAALAKLASAVRQRLPGMRYADDGAMESDGRWVRISDGAPQTGRPGLNCSGFAKWFVDGFYGPLAGKLMDIASLKTRWGSSRGNSWSDRYEQERDPWFGLDWSRNLAALLAAVRGQGAAGNPERFDVRDVPGFRYVEDVGYPMANLRAILWRLERRSPGSVYLGSLNKETGADPALRQHHHLAVLVPFVDSSERFQVAVFESGTETSLESVRSRFADEYIHLVRLDATGSWKPPEVE